MRSPERAPCDAYDEDARETLREIALASIERGWVCGLALAPSASDYATPLRVERACFVTLRKRSSGELRGCVGGLEARLPLVSAIAESAFNAAFRDPRFPGLRREELADIELHISVLSPLEALTVASERELCDLLRPGIDGLVLTDGGRSATFLPDVWQNLEEPTRFVRELKKKAGMPQDHWSSSMQVQLYTSESF